ncbi:MAG: SRPBCC family protein [Gemmatimonadota bacterium]
MMKWFAIVGGGLAAIVAVAVLVLLALSLRPGAKTITGETVIDRPPADVWPWIVQGERLMEWVAWLTEVEDLTPGVEGVGARRRWVMIDPTMGNQRVEIEGLVTGYEPERRSTMALDSPGMFTGEATYELVDLGDGRTRVEYVSEFSMQAWFGRLLEPLVTWQAAGKAADDLARLKERIEGASPAT